ncbi:MAG: hypothetical protein ACI9BH_001418 [Paracoccaceae bacterium]|jgi:hypothetical protein
MSDSVKSGRSASKTITASLSLAIAATPARRLAFIPSAASATATRVTFSPSSTAHRGCGLAGSATNTASDTVHAIVATRRNNGMPSMSCNSLSTPRIRVDCPAARMRIGMFMPLMWRVARRLSPPHTRAISVKQHGADDFGGAPLAKDFDLYL